MIKFIKDMASLPFDKDHEERFFLENLTLNLKRAKIIIVLTFLIELGVITTFLIYHTRTPFTENSKFYLIMYGVFLVVSATFYIFFSKKQKKLSLSFSTDILSYGYVIFMLGWNMGISLMDGTITSYILALMAVGMIGVLKARGIFIVLGLVQAVFCILLPIYSDQSQLFASYVNSFVAIFVAIVSGRILFRNRLYSFASKIEVENKTKQLESLNQELNKANKKLEYLAKTDGLTGIYNRRMFDELSKKYCYECASDKKSLAVIMIDIDHFKIYNDTYGHQSGDDCLKAIVSSIKKLVPNESMLARYGGEEFAILIKDFNENQAINLAEEIRLGIVKDNIEHINSPIKPYVTLSFGVFVGFPSEKMSDFEFVSLADKALYSAKNSGRNMVVAYESLLV